MTWNGREGALFKGVPTNAEGELFVALLKKYAPRMGWWKRGRGKRAELAEANSYWHTDEGIARAEAHNLDLEIRRKASRRGYDNDLPLALSSHFSIYPRNMDKVHTAGSGAEYWREKCYESRMEANDLNRRAVGLEKRIVASEQRSAKVALENYELRAEKKTATTKERPISLSVIPEFVRSIRLKSEERSPDLVVRVEIVNVEED